MKCRVVYTHRSAQSKELEAIVREEGKTVSAIIQEALR